MSGRYRFCVYDGTATPLGAGASCENDSNACDFAKGIGCNGFASPLQTMGTCPNPAGDGQACDDKVHCMAPASCVGGLCRLPRSASCSK